MPARGSIQRKETRRGVVYRARIRVGERPDGSPEVASRTFTQRKLAAAWLNEVSQAVQAGGYVRESALTVGELVERWLALPDERRGANTRRRYASALRAQVLPWLGGVRVGRLTTLMLQDHFDTRRKQGAGATAIEGAHAALSGALKQAVKWRVIPSNPLAGVVVERPRPVERPVLTAAQADAFIRATAADEPYGSVWALLTLTGLRVGEVLALEWADVDLEHATLTVRRHLSRDERSRPLLLAGAKSRAGRRTIALTLPAVALLRKQRERVAGLRTRHSAIWEDGHGDLVFPNDVGLLLNQHGLCRRFKAWATAAGRPELVMHDLRHTRATHLLAANVPLKIVSAILGHASVGITADRYQHVTPEIHAGVTGPLEELMTRR